MSKHIAWLLLPLALAACAGTGAPNVNYGCNLRAQSVAPADRQAVYDRCLDTVGPGGSSATENWRR